MAQIMLVSSFSRSVRLILAQIMLVSSFSRSFTASSIIAVIYLFGGVLEVIETVLHKKIGFELG